jgi:hypothetical protein
MNWHDRGERICAEMTERLAGLSLADLAYTAGLFDGEACFTVEAPGIQANGRRKAGRVRIMVGMTTPDVLRWLKETYGGGFYAKKARVQGSKPVHLWCLSGRSAGMLLEKLRPFLRVKQEAADIAIAFHRRQLGRPGAWKLDPTYVADLMALKAEMLRVNRRGVDEPIGLAS